MIRSKTSIPFLACVLILSLQAWGQRSAVDLPGVLEALADAAERAHPGLMNTDLPAGLRTLPSLGERPPLPAEVREADRVDLIDALELAARAEAWHMFGEGVGAPYVLFAFPTDDERVGVRVAAGAVIAFASRGARAIDAALDAIDTDPARAGGAPAEVVDRATLARETVLPLLAARAGAWLVAATPAADPQRASILELAKSAATGGQPVSPWAGLHRSTTLAALAALEGVAAERTDLFEAARAALADERLEARATSDQTLLGILAALVRLQSANPAQARRAMIELEEAPPFVRDGRIDLRLSLQLAGARARVERILAAFVGGDEAAANALGRAVGAHARLLIAENTEEPSESVRRAMVYRRLPPIVASFDPAIQRPALALAALAAAVDPRDEEARGAAIHQASAAADALADDPFIVDLLFESARLMAHDSAPMSRSAASEMFATAAESDPTAPRAGQAVALACATAQAALDASPESARLDAEDALLERLRLAHRSPALVPDRDAYRLQLLDLLALRASANDAEAAEELAAEAGAVAASVEDRTIAPHATARAARTWWSLLASGSGPTERVAEALVASADRMWDAADADATGPDADAYRAEAAIFRAEALLALDRAEEASASVAAVELEALSDERRVVFEPALLSIRARAHGRRGQATETLTALMALHAVDPQRAERAARRVVAAAWADVEPVQESLLPLDPPRTAIDAAANALDASMRYFDDMAGGVDAATARAAGIAALAAGRAERAAELLEALMLPGRPDPALDLPLAQALLASGDDLAGFAILRTLATALEAEAPTSRAYLQSWVLMLEALQRQNRLGNRSDEIRREVRRLREIPTLADFPECQQRLDAVRRAVSR